MTRIILGEDCGNSPKNLFVQKLAIQRVLSHGSTGAVNGTLKSKDGSRRLFCDAYTFNGAKATRVNEITSYVIEQRG